MFMLEDRKRERKKRAQRLVDVVDKRSNTEIAFRFVAVQLCHNVLWAIRERPQRITETHRTNTNRFLFKINNLKLEN